MSKIPKQSQDPVTIHGSVYTKRADILNALGAREGSELYTPTSYSQYLWEYENDDVDLNIPKNYNDSILPFRGCSSFHSRYVCGRSFDWAVSDQVTFKCKLRANGHNIIGMTGAIKGATYQNVCLGNLDPYLIPHHLADGINESQMYCSILVVPNDLNPSGDHVGHGPIHIPATEFVFHVLSHYTTVEEVKHDLDNYTIDIPPALQALGYECHYHIAAKGKHEVLEFKDGEFEWVRHSNVVTNFQLHSVDATQYRTWPELGTGAVLTDLGFSPHAAGIERFKLISSTYFAAVDAAENLLDELKFSNTYDTAAYNWLSECVTGSITVDSPLSDLLHAQSVMVGWWSERIGKFGDGWINRDPADVAHIWFSVHQVVYEPVAGVMHYRAQEMPYWLTDNL